ncbi:hypothetical protein L208DRAFT_1249802 [Tricholoma matsutake]|nr:hypothetical protein L208DRAFT_1249802 [Tricholoma matsutake 945]
MDVDDAEMEAQCEEWEDIEGENAGLYTLPPGEEGMLHSHAGGETIFQQIIDSVDSHKRGDLCTRKNRIQERINSWRKQLPLLVNAYLAWRKDRTCSSQLDAPSMSAPVDMVDEPTTNLTWKTVILNFYEYTTHSSTHASDTTYTNKTLAHHGFIGASPEKPVIAFSFQLFEVYRQLHRVCLCLSLDALSRSLNHLHHVPWKSYLAEQLSSAYDCYLEILCVVDACVQQALGRDRDWNSCHLCPPCMYKLTDEPPMKFSMLVAMDGNNSLKLVDSTFCSGSSHTDDRTSTSSRWLTPEDVDQFKDKVVNSHHNVSLPSSPKIPSDVFPPNLNSDAGDDDIAWLNIAEDNETQKIINICVERWQSAGPEARKKMFTLFAVAGIFVAICCHGHLLVICDMIRSREL